MVAGLAAVFDLLVFFGLTTFWGLAEQQHDLHAGASLVGDLQAMVLALATRTLKNTGGVTSLAFAQAIFSESLWQQH